MTEPMEVDPMHETLAKRSDNQFCYEPSADNIAEREPAGRYQEAHQCEEITEYEACPATRVGEEAACSAKVIAVANTIRGITAGVRAALGIAAGVRAAMAITAGVRAAEYEAWPATRVGEKGGVPGEGDRGCEYR